VTATVDGLDPTGMVAITEAVAVSITETVLSVEFVTYPLVCANAAPVPKPAKSVSINMQRRISFDSVGVNFVIVTVSLSVGVGG